MANYPVWWDTTITIYNQYKDQETDYIRWYRTVVKGAFWKNTGNKVTVGEISLDTSNTICRIREDDNYLEPHEWIKLPNDQMETCFTLGVGDIIVKGEVDDDIDDYAKGKRSTDLIAKYSNLQGCMQIERVGINVGAGRNNPHYYVTGT